MAVSESRRNDAPVVRCRSLGGARQIGVPPATTQDADKMKKRGLWIDAFTRNSQALEPDQNLPALLASWTFRRGLQSLTMQREAVPGGEFRLVVIENGRLREYKFASLQRLVPFQSAMEAWLLDGGWSLAEFAPDRRQGGDRRGLTRDTVDRRRWWTTVKP